MTQVIIDGDACPVINSVIELTEGTGIFVTIVRSFSHFSTIEQPEHVKPFMSMMDQMRLTIGLLN